MTGLDVNKHKLLEVAIVISDSKFNIVNILLSGSLFFLIFSI